MWGQILVARKQRLGFALRFIGELGWIGIGFALHMSSIWLWGFLFLGAEAYGFWRWRRVQA